MSRKQRGQGRRSNPSSSAGVRIPRLRPIDSGANVFTWTGPGIENIFIDFEPARSRTRRRLWKDAHPNNHGEASERPDHNG